MRTVTNVTARCYGPETSCTTLTPAASDALIHGAQRRCKAGGINESEAIQAFRDSRAHYNAGDLNSDASLDNEGDVEPKYDPFSGHNNLDQALHDDLDVTDENMKWNKGGR